MKVSITSAVLGLILIACSHGSPEVTAAPSPDAVKAAIAANNQAFAKAIIAKDTTALTNLFTDDAVFIAPIGGFIHGRAALAALWAERLQKASFLDGGITTESLDVRGDLAIEASTIAWTIQAGDNPPARRTGRALTVWHRDVDGRWRMLADYPAYDPPK
ncbi:MAG: YybH family protein [Archangium sp.]